VSDKESTLAIVVRTVDNATAGLRAINAHIKSLGVLAAPVQLIGERLGALAKEAGLPRVIDGVKGVGSAVGSLAGKLAMAGGIAAGFAVAAGHGLFELVGQFDDLGDKSERLGVTNDFLASMRYAAEKSGASVEDLDAGMQAFVTNLGAAKAGKGSLFKFLSAVSPALLSQLKAAKSNESAFGLLADAMAKVEDPAKRLALAEKAGIGANLAPLLAKGSAGLMELKGSFIGLAGSQEEAADRAGAVDDSMHDLNAATTGVKAALVAGLSPALKTIIEQITTWLSGHREDVRRWADDVGKKLPGAVDSVVAAVKSAAAFVGKFVDSIGGWKVAAGALALVIAGPLISSIASLGLAMATSPFGLIVIGVAAATAGVISLYSELSQTYDLLDSRNERLQEDLQKLRSGEMSKASFDTFHPGVRAKIDAQQQDEEALVAGQLDQSAFDAKYPGRNSQATLDIAKAMGRGQFGTADPSSLAPAAPLAGILPGLLNPGAGAPQEVKIKVDFANAPKGTRVSGDPRNTADVDLSVGYLMGGS